LFSLRLDRLCLLLSVVALGFPLSVVPSVQAQVSFTLSVSPGRVVLGTRSGLTDRFGVTVIAGQGFNGTVTFSVTGVPAGVSAVFQDWGAYLTSLAIFTTYLDIASSPNATLGDYVLTVSATSQRNSSLYIVSTRVSLVIQENGELRPLLRGNATRTTAPSGEQENMIPLTILALAVGAVLGSVTTYVLIRENRRAPRRSKHVTARP
jgi:uncharacterized membrane protein